MEEKLLKKFKKDLEKEKVLIEEELQKFAKKDKTISGDWDTKYPKWDGETGLETETDEVEEYLTRLPIEYGLELKLKAVNAALEKISRGRYGICDKCGKEIEIEKLKANPVAKLCLKCKK